MRLIKNIVFLMIIVFLASTNLYSHYYNNYQHLIGDRAAGMGGSYTALANTGTALWYNPAGLADIGYKSISISANSYAFMQTKTEGFLEVPAVSGYNKIDSKESDLSAVATAVTFGSKISKNQGFAFGVFVPFQDNIRGEMKSQWDDMGNTHYLKNSYVLTSKYYTVLGGYGMELFRDFSIGLSIGLGYYESRFKREDIHNVEGFGQLKVRTNNVSDDTYMLTLQADLGLRYKISKNNIVGVNLKSPAWNLYDKSNVEIIASDSNSTDAPTWQTFSVDRNVFQQVKPLQLSIGYAFTLPNIFSVEIDFAPAFKTKFQKQYAYNVKLGAEYYINKEFILRAGFYTDFSQKDKIKTTTDKGNEPFADRIDYYSTTLSISYGFDFFGEVSKAKSWTTLGMNFRYGIGDILCRRIESTPASPIPNETDIVKDKKVFAISIFVAETVVF
ncbi:OmpP1/FadL family transporter [Spirochaetota bacterium]